MGFQNWQVTTNSFFGHSVLCPQTATFWVQVSHSILTRSSQDVPRGYHANTNTHTRHQKTHSHTQTNTSFLPIHFRSIYGSLTLYNWPVPLLFLYPRLVHSTMGDVSPRTG